MRLEAAVMILLLLTIAAIRFSDRIVNEGIVINPADASRLATAWHGDEALAGSSTISADAAHPFRWSCQLRRKFDYPFCGYEILLDKGTDRGIDLSKFQTIKLVIDYRGSADSVRISLKNYDPQYSVPKARETAKFNQVELPLQHNRQMLQAKLSDFNVPEWWILKNRIPFRYSRPQFDNVIAIEIATGSTALPGKHVFRLDSITLGRSLLSIEQWYLGILGCWIVLICLFLVVRIIDLQRDLKRRRALQDVALIEARQAQESARRDHLTGLLNRLGITDRYQQLLATGGGKPVAIMLIDVDHFKSINDRFGHMLGDEVLCAFAGILRQHTRDDDLIARWGGEEFLLVGRVS
ncbi:MAG TPA: GGDEF domain-containing protein, partial [Sphingomonas sp.]|nr:GGDEF domain-containing protein [Sphingomonas sp.]